MAHGGFPMTKYDVLSDEILARATESPKLFILSVIGHLDGLLIVHELKEFDYLLVTGKLWEILKQFV